MSLMKLKLNSIATTPTLGDHPSTRLIEVKTVFFSLCRNGLCSHPYFVFQTKAKRMNFHNTMQTIIVICLRQNKRTLGKLSTRSQSILPFCEANKLVNKLNV